jgi:uncharacterized protein
MPSAEFHRELVSNAEPAHAWKILTDVPRLVDWVTVVSEATELAPLEHYSAVLADKMGPFKLKAVLDIRVTDIEVERRIKVRATGEDRQVSSRIAVEATLRLEPDGVRTTIVVEGRYEVVGRAATMGAGIITQKANKLLGEFFDRAAQELN